MPSPIRKIVSTAPKIALVLLAVTIVAIIVAAASIIYENTASRVTVINYSELYRIAESGSAASLTIESDVLTVTNSQGTVLQATVTGDAIRQGLVEQFRKQNVPIEFRPAQTSLITTVLTWAVPIITVTCLGLSVGAFTPA